MSTQCCTFIQSENALTHHPSSNAKYEILFHNSMALTNLIFYRGFLILPKSHFDWLRTIIKAFDWFKRTSMKAIDWTQAARNLA
mmetsp:Transcript_923/g.1720  ORF Transcript_923/g.1720 Transcript_923/m.1720 type:complete len:84 (+) Transcript_923:860-1111(+)